MADEWNEEYLAELNKLSEFLRTYGTGEIVVIIENGKNTAYKPGDLIEKTYKQIQWNGRIGQYAAEFEVYANAMRLLETGEYDAALLEAEDLNTSSSYEEFRAYIEDGSELRSYGLNAFGTTEELYDYIMARKLEAAGDGYAAMEYYDQCLRFVDARDRKLSLRERLPEVTATPEPQTVKVGAYIPFGTYLQTADGDDDTPIEWLVLDVDGDRALLLSRYGLELQPYNEEYEDITWEDCTLRTWLNETFINEAFTEDEQSAILHTDVDNSQSQGYWDTDGGNDTQDRIFLLSYAEANWYLGVMWENGDNVESRVSPTDYAEARGAWTSDENKTADGEYAGWWWLRSPGTPQDEAACVISDGSLSGIRVFRDDVCVRPALWVNLESSIF